MDYLITRHLFLGSGCDDGSGDAALSRDLDELQRRRHEPSLRRRCVSGSVQAFGGGVALISLCKRLGNPDGRQNQRARIMISRVVGGAGPGSRRARQLTNFAI
ncbi:hypothetical protein VTK26DRAFT_3752 [Humicola hyalothermophila]